MSIGNIYAIERALEYATTLFLKLMNYIYFFLLSPSTFLLIRNAIKQERICALTLV